MTTTQSMTELDAARFVRAALELIRDALPEGAVREGVTRSLALADEAINGMDAPPWTEHESRPQIDTTWSGVIAGDFALAPNGEWYEVDSWARIGTVVHALLKIGDGTTKTTQDAGTPVTVRRGPTGQAVDCLRAGGLDVEVIGR